MSGVGWSEATLAEVATLYQGAGFPKELQGRVAGELGFYKVSDISRAVLAGHDTLGPAAHCISRQEAFKLRATPIPASAVVFARIGEAIGLNRRALLPVESLVDNNVVGVKARPGIGDRYLLHFLRTIKLRELSQATTVPAVRTSDLAAIRVPVPPSAEQQRIVSRIEELFSEIDEGERALERVAQLVERYRQSVLKAAVTGELTAREREAGQFATESGRQLLTRVSQSRAGLPGSAAGRSAAAAAVDGLPDLPASWVWATLDQLCGQFGNGLSRKPAHEPPGTPILRISALRPLSVNAADLRYYQTEANERLDGFTVERGDLLFTRYNGSRELVGVSGVYRGQAPVLHPDKLIKARVVSAELVLPDYLEIALNAGESWKFLTSCVKTSAGQHGIAGADIKRTPIPLPPFAEQRRIVELWRQFDAQSLAMRTRVPIESRRGQALRQSILKAAFSGQLVPQDPRDEPASSLLARLAAQAAEAPAAPRRRGRKA